MADPTLTSNLTAQDFFSTTLSAGISDTDTVIPLNAVPNGTEGFLVIDQDNSSKEIIFYSSKGASSVTCPAASTGRGQGGTTAVSHSSGATVKLNVVSQYWLALRNAAALPPDVAGGWVPAEGTWTYASATTMTVPANDAAKMSVGTKIRLVQTTTKYFYVTGISGTTITVNGGTDYTLANAAITSPFLSNASNPVSFPIRFAYTPTFVNFTLTNGTLTAAFSMIGKRVFVRFDLTIGAATEATGDVTISFPVTAATYPSAGLIHIGQASMFDTSAAAIFQGYIVWGSTTTAGIRVMTAGGTYVSQANMSSTIPMDWATGDNFAGSFEYDAA